MSESDLQERAKELARQWQGSVVPVEDDAITEARRERITAALGAGIERAGQRRARAHLFRRAIVGLSLAAGVALAIGIGQRVSVSSAPGPVAALAPPTSGVRALSGTVTLVRETRPSVVSVAELQMGDALTTGPGSTAEVHLGALARVDLGEAAALSVIPAHASAHRLRLDRGRIEAKVDDHPSLTPKLVVETPDVEVVVTGTVFEVEVHPDGTAHSVTAVAVTKGRVVVRRAGEEIAAVSAGQRWSSGPDAAASKVSTPAEPSKPAEAALRGGTLAEENRLFRAAVDARGRGDVREALTQIDTLLARYPASPLAAEARVQRMRALAQSGRIAEAAREARRYLGSYPSGPAREEALRIVADDSAPTLSGPDLH